MDKDKEQAWDPYKRKSVSIQTSRRRPGVKQKQANGLLNIFQTVRRLELYPHFVSCSYLSEQEGDGSKGKGPAVLVAEVGLISSGSVQHFVINVGDVQHQTDHQRET